MMKDFKVMSEADDSYHIQHANGKSFTVDKKGLSPKAQAYIAKMAKGGSVQKFDDGGDVQVPAALAPNTPEQDAQAVPAQATQPPIAATPMPASPVDPLVQQGLSTEQNLNQQEQDIKQAQQDLGAAQAPVQQAFQNYNDQLEQMKTPQQIHDEYAAKDQALMQGYMDQKIDPNRYVQNQSTGSKILTGIGMLLSGAGAGRDGQNMAMGVFQKAVNNDIEAQKNNQDKSMTLWKMNRQNMQDDQQADLATRNQMLTGIQAQVAQAASRSQNVNDHLKASQLVSQLEQQKIQNRSKLSQLGAGQSGGVSNTDPLNLVPQMVPPEMQKNAITEIGQAKAANQNQDTILNLFDQAAKDNRPATGLSGTSLLNTVPFYEAPSVSNMKMLMDPIIRDNDGRYNADEAADVHSNFPKWGDSDATVAKKRIALSNFIDHKKQAPTAKTYGIDVNNFASTSSNPVARLNPQQQSFYQWAKANPNDPKAAIVLKKLGVQ